MYSAYEVFINLYVGIRCSGEEDCVIINTISTSPSTVFASYNDSVCFQCNFGSGVDPNATFQIENADVHEDTGTVQNGVLLIYSKANIFSTRKFITVSCRNGSRTILALVFPLGKDSHWAKIHTLLRYNCVFFLQCYCLQK